MDWRIGIGLADWYWIGGLVLDWRIGIGLADWYWIGRLVMDWQIDNGLALNWWFDPGLADKSKISILFVEFEN